MIKNSLHTHVEGASRVQLYHDWIRHAARQHTLRRTKRLPGCG